MERTAVTGGAAVENENETVVVHVQLRPRRGATRKCLAAQVTADTLGALAAFAPRPAEDDATDGAAEASGHEMAVAGEDPST